MAIESIKTRDHARALILKAGITSDNITDKQLSLLRQCINLKMKDSGNYRGSYRMNRRVSKFMTCRTDQWKSREAISFNRDGFVGFCGWASSSNARPILDGGAEWLDQLNGAEE